VSMSSVESLGYGRPCDPGSELVAEGDGRMISRRDELDTARRKGGAGKGVDLTRACKMNFILGV
jgi:hypothetical protein